jgi:Two component regulator propeller
MRTFVFCAAIIFGFTAAAAADSTNSDWFARTWQTEDGLPNNNVNSIAQTADGFLWVATPLGLTRFDGVTFDDISLTNFVSNSNRGVSALLTTPDGRLRLQMDRGAILDFDQRRRAQPDQFTAGFRRANDDQMQRRNAMDFVPGRRDLLFEGWQSDGDFVANGLAMGAQQFHRQRYARPHLARAGRRSEDFKQRNISKARPPGKFIHPAGGGARWRCLDLCRRAIVSLR